MNKAGARSKWVDDQKMTWQFNPNAFDLQLCTRAEECMMQPVVVLQRPQLTLGRHSTGSMPRQWNLWSLIPLVPLTNGTMAPEGLFRWIEVQGPLCGTFGGRKPYALEWWLWEVELFRKFNRVMKCHEWSLSLARSLHTLWTRTTHQVSGTPFAFAKVAVFTIMYCEIRYDTILYFTTLCHTCTMLYYTILCYTMLYHTMLCYAVLFYTMLYRYCTILLLIVLLRSIWLRTCVLHTWILDIPWCTRRNDLGSTRDHVLGLWSNGYPFWTPVRYPQLLRLIHKFGLQRSWSPWARKNLRNQGIFKAKSHRLVLPCLSTVNAS